MSHRAELYLREDIKLELLRDAREMAPERLPRFFADIEEILRTAEMRLPAAADGKPPSWCATTNARSFREAASRQRKLTASVGSVITMSDTEAVDPLLTAGEVALMLKVTKDWVWDHSSRRSPYLPVIRMSNGALRYRKSGIEDFLKERERASCLRRKRR